MTSTSRRAFLLAPLLAAPTAAYARLVEPTWLEWTQRTCTIPGLSDSVRLVHLSDLHASHDVPMSLIENAIQMAIDSNPDLICVTGDFVTNSQGFDSTEYAAILSRLSRKAPTFAVLGNDDGGLWSSTRGGFTNSGKIARMVERARIDLLANRTIQVDCGLQITGMGDLWAGEANPEQAFQDADLDSPTILLAHNPDSKKVAADYSWRLMLSGHTHGGQVVAPIFGFCPAPVEDRRYIRGLKPWRERWIHVSCGVGSISGVRFRCRPEVTLLHLVPAT